MQGLRGVAEDHRARRGEALGLRERQRIGLALADAGEAPEPETERRLQLGEERPVVEPERPSRGSGASVQTMAERPSPIGSTATGPSGMKRSKAV